MVTLSVCCLFQFFLHLLQLIVEIVEAADAEVVAHTAAVGRDGLMVRNAAEAEKFLQTVEIGIAQADGLLAGLPLCAVEDVGVKPMPPLLHHVVLVIQGIGQREGCLHLGQGPPSSPAPPASVQRR